MCRAGCERNEVDDGMFVSRVFRIMDDDGSRSLNFEEFNKGIHDYGLTLNSDVRYISFRGDKGGACDCSSFRYYMHVLSWEEQALG